MNYLFRNTWVEIDLEQLKRNIEALRDYTDGKVKLAPVIKADAYGHGAVIIARELEPMGVEYLCVAALSEALELRENEICAPLLVMGYTENHLLKIAVEHNITLTIFEYEQAELLSRTARESGVPAKAHVKVDTGFHRLGKEPTDEFAEEILRMSRLPHLCLEGIFSHLRLADTTEDAAQFKSLSVFIATLKNLGVHFKYAHISDSIAAVKYKEYALDFIRPGAIIYGYIPQYQAGMIDVKPIMTFKTKITRIQKLKKGEGVGYDDKFKAGDNTVIGTLAAGYADGYPRSLSGKSEIFIRGKRAKSIGLIAMDQMIADVSDIPDARAGDEAIIWGAQAGAPSVQELAGLANTNKNNIISGISRRVPRVYMKGGAVVKILDYMRMHQGGLNE